MGGVGGAEEQQQTNEHKEITPGPALSGGVGKTRKKKNERTKLPSPIKKETPQTFTLKF